MPRIEPDAENGPEKTSAADAIQVRSHARQRSVRLLGKLSDSVMREISQALAVVLSID
jgi:mRNA-degrading endonuclease toxin of MazEF toxin-antitoxin module